jgi:hypothetical protein
VLVHPLGAGRSPTDELGKKRRMTQFILRPPDNELGSPNQGNNPKWLYYHEDLYIPTLNSIGGLSNTNEQARIEVFQAILDKQIIRPDTV